jgi:hypothetical protein
MARADVAPDRLTPAALGFSPHSGWAAVVCLGGPVSSPVVVERRRVLLTSAPLPREPYHLAKRSEGKRAREIVADAIDEARTLAATAIADLSSSAEAAGYQLMAGGVITGRGRPDFTLQQALSTHAAMHNAEGWLFREALLEAGQQLALSMTAAPPDGLYAEAAAAIGTSAPEIELRVRALGVNLGPPWGKDQKLSLAAAWLALAREPRA